MKRPKYRANRFYCCEVCKRRYALKMLVPKDGCCKDALLWDSESEYQRWCELKLLEKKGEISELIRQVPYHFDVIVAHPEDWDICQRSNMTYVADFTYYDYFGGTFRGFVVEDSKGYRTREYKKKKMMMKKIYGIDIKET